MTADDKIFLDLPFSKQLHRTALTYLRVMGAPFIGENKRPTRQYFQCRAYLNRLPRQTIKNIYVMLTEANKPCCLYDLEKMSKAFEKEKVSAGAVVSRDYDIDLAGFLRGGMKA